MTEEFVVTPWEVKGEIDYNRLIEKFGTQVLTDDLVERVQRIAGELHPMLRRRIFFSHRDFDWILNMYDKGEKFFLYTGRGPSGPVHLGHLTPWFLTKWLQEKFDVPLYFQMTDDEKYLHRQDLELGETISFSYDNALDVIALGFDPKKTKIFSDIEYSKTLYRIAVQVAKRVTFSTTRAVFGFDNSTNIGMIFFTSMQAVPAFLPSVEEGRNIPCLIPHAIDQDPHFRVARDVAPKLGFYKPAAIHCTFLPSLQGSSKMSSSLPETVIYTTEPADDAREKIMDAFTGGGATVEEHSKHGGNPDICPIYHYYQYIFEDDDEALKERYRACKSGELLCGEDKVELADRVEAFLRTHQDRREKAKDHLEEFMVRD